MALRYTQTARRALLARHFLLREADNKLLDTLLSRSVVVQFGDRQRIFDKGDEGDQLLGVLSGKVRIFVLSDEGRELLLNVLMPGDLFGEISLLDGKPRSASAVAWGRTDLLQIRRPDFLALLRSDIELCLKFMDILCERVRWASDMLEDSSLLDLPARLAKRLLRLADGAGTQVGRAIRIGVKLSQSDLGSMLGVTREAINKQLREWKNSGVVDTEAGEIVILDRKSLSAVANV